MGGGSRTVWSFSNDSSISKSIALLYASSKLCNKILAPTGRYTISHPLIFTQPSATVLQQSHRIATTVNIVKSEQFCTLAMFKIPPPAPSKYIWPFFYTVVHISASSVTFCNSAARVLRLRQQRRNMCPPSPLVEIQWPVQCTELE